MRLGGIFAVLAAVVAASALSGCSISMYAQRRVIIDDVYVTHNINAIAAQEAALAERNARLRQEYAELQANINAARGELYYEGVASSGSNRYWDYMEDTYEGAFERRLRGFESPTYRMPASYYNFYYGGDYMMTSIYDPAFYNVMVMGNQVWVEPRYITAMFGNWGRPYVSFGFGYYGRPYYSSWYNPFYNPYYSWNYPYYGWGWGYPSYNWGYSHWGWGGWGGYYNTPLYSRPSNIVSRPNYSPGNRIPATSILNTGQRTPSSYTNSNRTAGSSTVSDGNATSSYRNSNDNTVRTPSNTGNAGSTVRSSGTTTATDRGNYSAPPSNTTTSRSTTTSTPSVQSAPSQNNSSGGFSGGGSSSAGGGTRSR